MMRAARCAVRKLPVRLTARVAAHAASVVVRNGSLRAIPALQMTVSSLPRNFLAAANAAPNGIFQTDMSAKTVSHRQIPLGGGGCHGVEYVNGKLWIAALRLRGILRVDAKTWEPEFLIPYAVPRAHGVAWDHGAIWMVTGDEQGAGLIKYDAESGRVLETVRLAESDPDPHGLALHDGVLYSCDAGIHPGWPNNDSPTAGWIFQIDFV